MSYVTITIFWNISEEWYHISYKYRVDILVMILILRVGYKNNSCIRETQENLIKSSVQSGLPYILLQMVHASYYAPYSKWPCVKHEVNMWCLCCITSFCSRTFYFLFLNPVINVVTIPLDITDVTDHFYP